MIHLFIESDRESLKIKNKRLPVAASANAMHLLRSPYSKLTRPFDNSRRTTLHPCSLVFRTGRQKKYHRGIYTMI